MRIFYDTEFHESGAVRPIELISIGMVREDGAEYYAINAETNWPFVFKNEWLRDNVLTQLPGKIRDFHNSGGTFEPDVSTGLFKRRQRIAAEVSDFCGKGLTDGERAELWAYYADYDHVVLSQLFGRMIDLPSHMPMFTHDLKQAQEALRPDWRMPQQNGAEHDALVDARWVAARWADLTADSFASRGDTATKGGERE